MKAAGVVVLALVAATPGQGLAAEGFSAACMTKARTQADLNACAAAEARAADARLSRSYRAVACHLAPGEKTRLRTAQRAWIRYREAECAFWSGGDRAVAPMNRALCQAELSNKRADDLHGWPANASGDATAPCG